MESTPAPPPVPTPGRPPVRWGLPDVALAWVAGLVASLIAALIGIAILSPPTDQVDDDVGVLLFGLLGQNIGILGVLLLVSVKKGLGSLGRDFGLRRPLDHPWLWGLLYLLCGVALQIGLSLLLLPIASLADDDTQGVVDLFEDARGVELALFAAGVVVVAPFVEELLFRGALLRALLRKTSPGWAVFGSALAFAAVHVLLSPTIGDVVPVPALMGLGVVSGAVAVRTGNLYGSILLHAGFNLLTAVTVLVSA
jgi:hypothetical protein